MPDFNPEESTMAAYTAEIVWSADPENPEEKRFATMDGMRAWFAAKGDTMSVQEPGEPVEGEDQTWLFGVSSSGQPVLTATVTLDQ